MIAKTHSVVSVREAALFIAFELSRREWKLALTSGFGVAPWLCTIAAGDLAAPMSKRLNQGASIITFRGAQSPVLTWMQSAELAGAM